MGGVNTPSESPVERAIRLSDGMTALVRKLNERGHDITGHATVYQWKKVGRVPAPYCNDVEAISGVRRWDLRPDDWHRIWPQLIGAEGAPAIPDDRQAA